MVSVEPSLAIDTEILDRLVANHRRFLSFLERRLGSRDEAEELLQAAFVKGVEKAGGIRDEETAVAWFYRLLRNALIDHYRHRDAERRALETEAGRSLPPVENESEGWLHDGICQCVDGLIDTLKPEYARVIRLVDLDEEPIARAAEVEGISTGNARVRLHRARLALRKRLEQACGTCAEHACLDCSCKH